MYLEYKKNLSNHTNTLYNKILLNQQTRFIYLNTLYLEYMNKNCQIILIHYQENVKLVYREEQFNPDSLSLTNHLFQKVLHFFQQKVKLHVFQYNQHLPHRLDDYHHLHKIYCQSYGQIYYVLYYLYQNRGVLRKIHLICMLKK